MKILKMNQGIKKIHLDLSFDINTDISYRDFSKNELFPAEINPVNDDFMEGSFNYLGLIVSFKIATLLAYQRWPSINKIEEERISKMMKEIFQYKITVDTTGFTLEKVACIQDLIEKYELWNTTPKNILLGLLSDIYTEREIQIPDQAFNLKFIYKNSEKLSNELRKALSWIDCNITWTPEEKYNYLVFQFLIQNQDLYFISYDEKFPVICSADNLYKNIESSGYVINLSAIFSEIIPKRILDNLKDLKNKYSGRDKISVYLREIEKQFKSLKNVEIKILSKEFNTSKWSEIDEKLPNADIGFKKHKGKKQYIKVERTFKLKDKDDSL